MKAEVLGVFLDLKGRRVVVIGGGEIALQKIRSLMPTGAKLSVVARDFSPECRQYLSKNGIQFVERLPEPPDFDETLITYIATSDRDFNLKTSAVAKGRSALINVVDDPHACDFFSASIFRKGPVQIAISTGGAHPSLAKALRRFLEKVLPPALGPLAEQLALERENYKRTVADGDVRRQKILASIKSFEEKSLYCSMTTNNSEAAVE